MGTSAIDAPLPPLAELASRLDFTRALEQRGRLLQVETALPQLALIAERLVMHESINAPFELQLHALSMSRHLELKRLIGEPLSVRRRMADGSYRPWHGYVVAAAQLGADGGLARYRLDVRPWLHFLALRRDSFIHQDRTALEAIEDTFRDYPQANFELRISTPLRRRAICTQYRETDLAFVQRLLAEEGLSYEFRQLDGDAAAAADEAGQARHVMVIRDRHAPRDTLGRLRFAREGGCSAFSAQRRTVASTVTLASWDHRTLVGVGAEAASSLDFGDMPRLEHYDGGGAERYADAAHARQAAEIALAAQELRAKQFVGEGSARHLGAGQVFELVEHPLYGCDSPSRADGGFTLLDVEHRAGNDLDGQWGAGIGDTAGRGHYGCSFRCAPTAAAVVPAWQPKPTAPGLQSAIVVGLSGELVSSDRDLRVKVQFPWQRGEHPLAGGLPHPGPDAAGNAPGDERSGSWLRVAQASAGANWGSVFTPRIGSEVAVQFLDGDIDRPVIVGQLHNGIDTPPFAAGENAGANHPGVISGIHSQELDGAGFNQWLLDDATGQLRMRLMSSAAGHSQLGLGHLIQQAADSAQRGAWRGSGFEALTQGWGSLRAGRGLLISTSARAGSYGSAQSTQMDASEAVAQLKAARALGWALSEAARPAGAQALSSHAPGAAVDRFIEALQLDGFTRPQVLLDTPSSAALATEASITACAGQHTSLVAQGDLHQAAGHSVSQVSGGTSSLYAHEGGIKAIAANGPVSLRAHSEALQLWADKEVSVISVNDEIRIGAKSRIELIGGQASMLLEGGDVTFSCDGNFTVKGVGHSFLGGASKPAELEALPLGLAAQLPQEIELNFHYDDLSPIAGAPYKVRFEDGTMRQGVLDARGHAVLGGVPAGAYTVEFGEDPAPWQAPSRPADDAPFKDKAVQAQGRAQIEALLKADAPIDPGAEP